MHLGYSLIDLDLNSAYRETSYKEDRKEKFDEGDSVAEDESSSESSDVSDGKFALHKF